jgi:adenylate cyclase class 2
VLEVESKYRSPGNESIEKALIKLGAKKVSEKTMEDLYFSHPNKDFGKTDEALRLRKMGDEAELTYKGARMASQNTKAREELTLRTDNPLTAQRILERLGFREGYVVRKSRRTYQLDKLRIELDDVDGLGEYVELEVMTESPERSATLLETARKELALDKIEPKTYLELLIEKGSPRDTEEK